MKSPAPTLTALTETLELVLPKRWLPTREISKKIGLAYPYGKPTQSAVANRLQRLRAMGLVQCRRVGKEKHWRRA